MNIIDGRVIAEEIKSQVAKTISGLTSKPKLGILTCEPNLETRTYLELKKATATKLGIEVQIVVQNNSATTESLLIAVEELIKDCDGIIVQLPLPNHIDTDVILSALPKTKDVDAFNYQGEETSVLPPVVGAIDEISGRENVDWTGKKVVIFGAGKLVGIPAKHYALSKGAEVAVITKSSALADFESKVKEADIVVLGVGKQNLLEGEMVKEGVVVFDAGASEDGGVLVGDAAKNVAEKAGLITPVPGGIGPVTVALLFRNLLNLSQSQ